MDSEDVLGPATALDNLRPGEPCVVVRDAIGQMFVRPVRDEDICLT
jgi:hypothetical protein